MAWRCLEAFGEVWACLFRQVQPKELYTAAKEGNLATLAAWLGSVRRLFVAILNSGSEEQLIGEGVRTSAVLQEESGFGLVELACGHALI